MPDYQIWQVKQLTKEFSTATGRSGLLSSVGVGAAASQPVHSAAPSGEKLMAVTLDAWVCMHGVGMQRNACIRCLPQCGVLQKRGHAPRGGGGGVHPLACSWKAFCTSSRRGGAMRALGRAAASLLRVPGARRGAAAFAAPCPSGFPLARG